MNDRSYLVPKLMHYHASPKLMVLLLRENLNRFSTARVIKTAVVAVITAGATAKKLTPPKQINCRIELFNAKTITNQAGHKPTFEIPTALYIQIH